MLLNQDLPKVLWEEAMMTIICIQYRSTHKNFDNTTPEEVFKGKKSSVDHLRIFGSLAYIHVP